MALCGVRAMLTVLSIVPISARQSWHEARKGTASFFGRRISPVKEGSIWQRLTTAVPSSDLGWFAIRRPCELDVRYKFSEPAFGKANHTAVADVQGLLEVGQPPHSEGKKGLERGPHAIEGKTGRRMIGNGRINKGLGRRRARCNWEGDSH
jgi:hypothetical protein